MRTDRQRRRSWKTAVGQEILHGKISGEHAGSRSGGITVHYHDITEATRAKQGVGSLGEAHAEQHTKKKPRTHMDFFSIQCPQVTAPAALAPQIFGFVYVT